MSPTVSAIACSVGVLSIGGIGAGNRATSCHAFAWDGSARAIRFFIFEINFDN